MTVTFSCDCGREIAAPDCEAGQRMLCPGCFELVRVPVLPGVSSASMPSQAELKRSDDEEARTRGGMLMAISGLQVAVGAIHLGLPAAGLLAVLLLCVGGVFATGVWG